VGGLGKVLQALTAKASAVRVKKYFIVSSS
jgi:hypothetical protein